jgi:uncharacterized protein
MPAVRIQVRVQPRAHANEIVSFDEADRLRVRVTAPPADGSANAAVVSLLADALDVAKSAISIERGLTSRTKTILIDGIGADALRKAIGASVSR